ncbi:MAG: methionine--tRNA ligase [Gammaproteobacteria bacterium]|jgi:methionyl-tRNA synthetase
MREIIITNALPYANGPLHLGHMLGYIQADIWARFLRLQGHRVWHVCGDDAHGTPIMLHAEKLGIAPEEMVAQIKVLHERDFNEFNIAFDNFYTTHSEENKQLTDHIYLRLKEHQHIFEKNIKHAFDPEKNMFLPDRYVKGECPRCHAKDQYGDSCEVCGATYAPTDLINPVSVLSGATPIEKESIHFFFNLPEFEALLRTWLNDGHLQDEVRNKLQEWFEAGLQAWDISRDAPYFGFEIPGAPGKYFYVWLDAPIGYMASLLNLSKRNPLLDFPKIWHKDSPMELHHFIGKDIMYFHALFWPAVLHGAGYRLPTSIFANGFLTINGFKMSKSRGTFIKARSYLEHLNPEYLRYYFATKLNRNIDDLDFNTDDFIARVNSDLVGKFVNIASRCAKMINSNFDNRLSSELISPELFNHFVHVGEQLEQLYEQRDFSKAMREIMTLADSANQMIDTHKPWALIKNPDTQSEAHKVCTLGLNLFRQLVVFLKPVLPELAAKAEDFLEIEPLSWDDHEKPLLNHTINVYEPLLQRIDIKQVNAMMETEKPEVLAPVLKDAKPEITIDDFNKIDLRVAKVISAAHVEGADKLIQLHVELDGHTRQIFAGIKSAYQPEDLVGKQVVIVANLKPRQMRFGLSEGMVLCASSDNALCIVQPQNEINTGATVK